MTLQIISQIIQHIQPCKNNCRQWLRIGCRHWALPENKYSCSQQKFPRTSACFAWAVEKSPNLFLRSNHWRIQPQRLYWYQRHCSYFSLIINPSMARCCCSFQNWTVSSPFPSSSYQQWWSCSQALSCALHSSCAPPSGQWLSRYHLNSSHGFHRLQPKIVFRVSHLPLCIGYLFVKKY